MAVKRAPSKQIRAVGPDGLTFEVDPDAAARLKERRPESILPDDPARLLATKEGDMFLYATQEGNLGGGGTGLYFRDTRFLSHYEMQIGGQPAVLLSSSAERASMSYIDCTNPEVWITPDLCVEQQTLNIRRTRVISNRLYERIRVKNYNAFPVQIEVKLELGADFSDLFEVRGLIRERAGTFFRPRLDGSVLTFAYLGEDSVYRLTRVELGAVPTRSEINDGIVTVWFTLDLGAHYTRVIHVVVEPIIGEERRPMVSFETALHELRRSYEDWERACTVIDTDNELFNRLLQRGLRDLRALITDTSDGRYIAAGIPWYVAPFGRDSLLTSHQILMVNPEPARDTLRMLARWQGQEVDPWRDEEPGKILHEIRRGELASAMRIPHTPYYGSVDSTPLFLMLLATYFKWTDDRAFVVEMLPHADRALKWIDEYGDFDGDGFVEYEKRSPLGLDNQGWKDSKDSIAHADGSLAKPPIALAEVQAYVYCAKRRMAEVYEYMGDTQRADLLLQQAATLKRKFNEQFWLPEEGYFAMALDGDKNPVRTISTNPAHGLYCEIIDREHASDVAERLLEPDMFSGWGVRTMSKSGGAYNPMSYHNGSVWPHDNAFIAAGLKRYGFHRRTNRLATSLFDAAIFSQTMRLPELFCGFTRRSPNRPVSYPVACSPQAWAAGAPFLMLQAMLGLSARAHENLLTINSPVLPAWLNVVELKNLRIGSSTISLTFKREGDMTSFSLVSKQGSLRVVMEE
ncbi:MAG: glycogen debranching N-terminal domain-containing protein [Actinomycetota bacterium]